MEYIVESICILVPQNNCSIFQSGKSQRWWKWQLLLKATWWGPLTSSSRLSESWANTQPGASFPRAERPLTLQVLMFILSLHGTERTKNGFSFPTQEHHSLSGSLLSPKGCLTDICSKCRVSPFSRTPGWPTLSRSYSTPWNERRNPWLQHSALRNAARFNKWPNSHFFIACEGITSPTKFYWIFWSLFLMSKTPGCLEDSPGSASSDLCNSTAAPSPCGLSAALRVHKQNPAKSYLPAKWKVNTCSHIAARAAYADLPGVLGCLEGLRCDK